MVYAGAVPTLTGITYSGFVGGDTAASLTTAPSLSTTATSLSPVSGNPYPITASGAYDPDYDITYDDGDMMIEPAASVTTVSALPSPSVVGQSVTIVAKVTGAGATQRRNLSGRCF